MSTGGDRWRGPAARLPLRWGRFGDRLAWGGMLILGGTTALAGADTYQLLILLAGTVACFAGWGILPCSGWRRLVAAVPATLAGWMLLGGPRFVAVLLLVQLGWLLVRHRPALAWLTALLPLGTGIAIAASKPGYDGMLLALALEGLAVIVACGLASFVPVPSRSEASPS